MTDQFSYPAVNCIFNVSNSPYEKSKLESKHSIMNFGHILLRMLRLQVNRLSAIIFYMIVFSAPAFAQPKIIEYNLKYSKAKRISNSRFNRITLIDQRLDTTTIGFRERGGFSSQKRIVSVTPLSEQFSRLMASITDKTRQDGELVMQLRRLNLSENTKGSQEFGHFVFRANLFQRQDTEFRRIGTIDTIVNLQGISISRKLVKASHATITNFIARSLRADAISDSVLYSARSIEKIDSVEKSRYAIFSVDSIPDGLYRSWFSLRNLKPSMPIIAKMSNDKFIRLRTIDKRGIKGPPPMEYFAVVYKGQIYIRTFYGHEPLVRSGDNFMYEGRLTAGGNGFLTAVALGATGGVPFLVAGGVLAATGNRSAQQRFRIMIDHLNGSEIPISRVEE